MSNPALKLTCLWHTSLPVEVYDNASVIAGFIGYAMSKCGASPEEVRAFWDEIHGSQSYRATLAVCARMIDMDEWLDAHGYEDVPR